MPDILDFLDKKYSPSVKKANLATIKGKKAEDDPQLLIDFEAVLREVVPYLSQVEMEHAIRWMLGWIKYTQDKKGIKRKFANRQYNKDRGRLVFIELHGHFGKELTFPHLAVVLANGYNWILVAPISTNAYNKPNEPLYIDLIPGNAYDTVQNTCGVMLNNLRVISKNRILDQFGKIRSSKLDEIDKTIVEHFIPQTHKKIQELVADVDEKNQEIDRLNKDNIAKHTELQRLAEEIRTKDEEIERLKDNIRTLLQKSEENSVKFTG